MLQEACTDNSKTMDDLVEKLDDDATQNFIIAKAGHSRIIEFRKQLKIKAVQAAKEKAVYLTESVGERLGEAITITEPTEWQPVPYNNFLSNTISNENYTFKDSVPSKSENGDVDFKKLKLRFEVSAVFALK